MLLERLLKYEDAKQPYISSAVFCSFWREFIRQRIKLKFLVEMLDMSTQERNEFKAVFIEPYKDWTRSERIQHTRMVQDIFSMSERTRRVRSKPYPVSHFMNLLDTYEKDKE